MLLQRLSALAAAQVEDRLEGLLMQLALAWPAGYLKDCQCCSTVASTVGCIEGLLLSRASERRWRRGSTSPSPSRHSSYSAAAQPPLPTATAAFCRPDDTHRNSESAATNGDL